METNHLTGHLSGPGPAIYLGLEGPVHLRPRLFPGRRQNMGIMVHGDPDARVPRPLRSHLHVDPFHGHLSGMGMAEAMEGDAGQAHPAERLQ